MNKFFYQIFAISTFILLSFTTNGQNTIEMESENVKLRGVAELGYVAVLDHKIQFSQNGTYIDYVKDGGQNTLFPVSRLSLELEWNKKNTVYFLYQPLRLETKALLDRDLVIDDLTYPAGSSVNFLYNFPFYRLSYTREFLSNNDKFDFAFGATVQIRNATIEFESTDGLLFRQNTDIGIVPALKMRTRANFTEKLYGEIEADGIYAPVSYLNGSTNEITGAILDASVRLAYKIVEPADAFLNIRYLGGGAVGTSSDNDGPGDGYVRNWLHFLTVTTGFVYEF